MEKKLLLAVALLLASATALQAGDVSRQSEAASEASEIHSDASSDAGAEEERQFFRETYDILRNTGSSRYQDIVNKIRAAFGTIPTPERIRSRGAFKNVTLEEELAAALIAEERQEGLTANALIRLLALRLATENGAMRAKVVNALHALDNELSDASIIADKKAIRDYNNAIAANDQVKAAKIARPFIDKITALRDKIRTALAAAFDKVEKEYQNRAELRQEAAELKARFAAATQIQAAFRGYRARKAMQGQAGEEEGQGSRRSSATSQASEEARL